ncbi:MAG TPA: hypothetical protein VH988_20785 [Thermoanaerobaculia bacterium]|jgi:hypothetical protein|nr:hypothetical protein [Thermoanaerobaculia bacterium]
MAKAKVSGSVTFGSTQILYGLTPKYNLGSLKVPFYNYGPDFDEAPIVTVTPFWAGQSSQVGFVETLIEIDKDHFTVTSQNADPNYSISWIAIGSKKS